MRVLIVDDEPHILDDLGTALRQQNCKVETASSVEQARKLVSTETFDWAVIDLNLDVTSGGYGGIELYKLARQLRLKSVILSAYPFEQVDEQLKKSSTQREAEDILREIACNYIYKGEQLNYIEAILAKLGVDDKLFPWYGNYHALLIAVQDYERSVCRLQYPILDARKLQQVLSKAFTFPEANITKLENPSRYDVFSELYAIGAKLTADDNLLIFYAGHGHWDDNREQGYWLPKDARLNNPANWISNGDIRDFIRGIKTQHTLLISDACFSGAILRMRSASPDSKTIQEKYRTRSRRVIASGSPTQMVPDRSVFLDYLINRLNSCTDQHLYAERLYVEVCNEFIAANLSAQNPVYGSIQSAGDKVGGDFIFIMK